MLIIYLIHITERDKYCSEEDAVRMFSSKEAALSYVNSAATQEFEGVQVQKVLEVDVNNKKIVELVPCLEGFKVVLVPKEANI